MLKQLRFEGFAERPDLLAHFQGLMPDLEQEVGRWANRVETVIELRHPNSERPFVWLTLSLTLPHSAASDSAVAPYEDIKDPTAFRKWARFVWGNVLDKLIELRAGQTEPELTSSAGA